jgi:hypothetical protein
VRASIIASALIAWTAAETLTAERVTTTAAVRLFWATTIDRGPVLNLSSPALGGFTEQKRKPKWQTKNRT